MFATHPPTKPDFSIRAYEQFIPERPRGTGRLSRADRALRRGATAVILRVLNAIRQAAAGYANLTPSEVGREAQASGKPRREAVARSTLRLIETSPDDPGYEMRIRCPVTGTPCEDDHAHFCIEWGCGRKGGLSLLSHENYN